MNTKAKGRRNERRSAEILERAGYRVTVSAASLGPFDLVGVSATGMVLVQVKTNAWPCAAEWETLGLFPCPENCLKIVHRWDDYKRVPYTEVVE